MHRGEKGIVESDELWRSSAAANGAPGELFQRRDQIGIVQQVEIVRHGLERTPIRELPLNFLERHDLGR